MSTGNGKISVSQWRVNHNSRQVSHLGVVGQLKFYVFFFFLVVVCGPFGMFFLSYCFSVCFDIFLRDTGEIKRRS